MKDGRFSKIINQEKQAPHMASTALKGKSYFDDDFDAQKFLDRYAGTGMIERQTNGRATNKEIVFLDKDIEYSLDGIKYKTNNVKIHHSKNRTHIVPRRKIEDEI